MNEKEKRLSKAKDKTEIGLFWGMVLSMLLLGLVSVVLIVTSVADCDWGFLSVGILGLCFFVGFIIYVGVEIAVDHKIKNEVKRREENAKNNKEKLNELLQTNEITKQDAQAK